MALPNGPEIRLRRLRNGWTQAELAQRIGRTQAAVSKVETGKPVSHVLMRQVARALKSKLTDITLPYGPYEALSPAEEDDAAAQPAA